MSLQSVNNTPSISSPFTVTPSSPSSPHFERVSDEEDRASIFSPGPTFVDDIADDMDDEKMMVQSYEYEFMISNYMQLPHKIKNLI